MGLMKSTSLLPVTSILLIRAAIASDECDGWINDIPSFDADSSGGLSKREFKTFLDSVQTVDINSSQYMFEVSYYSIACYYPAFNAEAGCCVGDEAAISLSTAEPLNVTSFLAPE